MSVVIVSAGTTAVTTASTTAGSTTVAAAATSTTAAVVVVVSASSSTTSTSTAASTTSISSSSVTSSSSSSSSSSPTTTTASTTAAALNATASSTATPSSSTLSGGAIGGIAAGAAVLLLGVLAVVLWRCRSKKQHAKLYPLPPPREISYTHPAANPATMSYARRSASFNTLLAGVPNSQPVSPGGFGYEPRQPSFPSTRQSSYSYALNNAQPFENQSMRGLGGDVSPPLSLVGDGFSPPTSLTGEPLAPGNGGMNSGEPSSGSVSSHSGSDAPINPGNGLTLDTRNLGAGGGSPRTSRVPSSPMSTLGGTAYQRQSRHSMSSVRTEGSYRSHHGGRQSGVPHGGRRVELTVPLPLGPPLEPPMLPWSSRGASGRRTDSMSSDGSNRSYSRSPSQYQTDDGVNEMGAYDDSQRQTPPGSPSGIVAVVPLARPASPSPMRRGSASAANERDLRTSRSVSRLRDGGNGSGRSGMREQHHHSHDEVDELGVTP